jgi:thiol:disulfide interchange protein DsbD
MESPSKSNTNYHRQVLRLASVIILLLIPLLSFAEFDAERDVPVWATLSRSGVVPGDSLLLAVVFEVPNQYHITDTSNGLFYLQFDSISFGKVSETAFPPGEVEEESRVYRGKVIVTAILSIDPTYDLTGFRSGKTDTLHFHAGYQVCQEFGNRMCFFPVDKEIALPVLIVPKGSATLAVHPEIFGEQAPVIEAKTLSDRLTDALNRGSILALLLVFVGGILLSFTPCVYPVIPITIGYIGARAQGKPFRGFLLSLSFVLGIAVVYSALGVFSAATGTLFGSISGSPGVRWFVVAVFVIMGFSMIGAFDLSIPASWQGKLQKGKRQGFGGAFVIGMVSSLVIAPCVGPVLVALLTWVAKSGSIVLGFTYLFVLSLGLGLLFLVIGTLSGALTALPQAGAWMEAIKKIFGILLFAGAFLIIKPVISAGLFQVFLGAFLVMVAVGWRAFQPGSELDSLKAKLGKAISILLLVLGILYFVLGVFDLKGINYHGGVGGVAETAAVRPGPPWIVNHEQEALSKASQGGKPVIIDFYADWCAACVELDKKTWPDSRVITKFQQVIPLKMNFTKTTTFSKQMMAKYKITGMPTVIFLGSDGSEKGRFTGYKSPEDFIQFFDKTL